MKSLLKTQNDLHLELQALGHRQSPDNLLDTFIKIFKFDLLYRDPKPTKLNKKLTKNQHKSLTELSDQKKADRGSAIVVMNTNGCIKEAHNQQR